MKAINNNVPGDFTGDMKIDFGVKSIVNVFYQIERPVILFIAAGLRNQIMECMPPAPGTYKGQ